MSTEHQERKNAAVLTHTLDPWVGVKRSNIFFVSKSGHVAYQIKVKEVYSNMQGRVLKRYFDYVDILCLQ